MKLKKIMVIGAGQMGSGIAQVCAQAGYDVLLHDLKPEHIDRGLQTISKNINRQVEKGRMSESEKSFILARLCKSTDIHDAGGVDIVIEAVVENMDIKRNIFAQLDEITPDHTILASNTSSRPAVALALSPRGRLGRRWRAFRKLHSSLSMKASPFAQAA